jgi:hypothetical protein
MNKRSDDAAILAKAPDNYARQPWRLRKRIYVRIKLCLKTNTYKIRPAKETSQGFPWPGE